MKRVLVLACPSCGGALEAATSSTFLDCPSCAQALAVRTGDGGSRRAVLPEIGPDRAMEAARACWKGPMVPAWFLVAARIEPPQLLFVAFYEAERTLVVRGGRRPVIIETLDRAPAVDLPDVDLNRLDTRVLDRGAAQIPFVPVMLQRKGTVFDPSRPVAEVAPPDSRTKALEERVRIVYLPIWVVRCRHLRNFYDVAVDGVTGVVLRGRAPAERTARLSQAIAALYVLAFAAALATIAGRTALLVLLQMHQVGIPLGLGALSGLAFLLSWAWDRVRFRYEVVTEGDRRALRAINRPQRTAPEKIRDVLFQGARSFLDRKDRGLGVSR